MNTQNKTKSDFIWGIANELRGPYRPPQYRLVMLPITVLRRIDCVLEPNEAIIGKIIRAATKKKLATDTPAFDNFVISKLKEKNLPPVYNLSEYSFSRLLNEPDAIARNFLQYIASFSSMVREIFDNFNFEQEIERLDDAGILYSIVQEFSKIDLSPRAFDNLGMGAIFEDLVRRFNEQANEEAGDYFTPREVIKLMANIIYTNEQDVYKPDIVRSIYDPTCGTGGMLSVSEEHIRNYNKDAVLSVYGQDYNKEAYAICRADMLIKGEETSNIKYGDTLGNGKSGDQYAGVEFHYMLANPPFGVEWKTQHYTVKKEHKERGFKGRFGAGLPRISDGALLFLLHMLSKMKPVSSEGSRIAIVFNGSPLFTGDAGSGESNIRRWIIENDWLETIIALPNQMFYNTGIFTYIWVLSNRKAPERVGKVQLIDATAHYVKMRKSLGDKRNQLSDENIREITRLYADFEHDAISHVMNGGKLQDKICSKIVDARAFGFLKMTVERPLRLNFQVSGERIDGLQNDAAFVKLATSRKIKNEATRATEIAAGERLQADMIAMLEAMDGEMLYKNRDDFFAALEAASIAAELSLSGANKKLIVNSLGRRDASADICTKSNGHPEPDPELRDTERVPLPDSISFPLPLEYDSKASNADLLEIVRDHCEAYLKAEVLPHVADAWIDHSKLKLGYEIPLNRYFYVYEPPRALDKIEQDIKAVEDKIASQLEAVTQ